MAVPCFGQLPREKSEKEDAASFLCKEARGRKSLGTRTDAAIEKTRTREASILVALCCVTVTWPVHVSMPFVRETVPQLSSFLLTPDLLLLASLTRSDLIKLSSLTLWSQRRIVPS